MLFQRWLYLLSLFYYTSKNLVVIAFQSLQLPLGLFFTIKSELSDPHKLR